MIQVRSSTYQTTFNNQESIHTSTGSIDDYSLGVVWLLATGSIGYLAALGSFYTSVIPGIPV
jgi:hypothetical protein